MFNMDHCKVCLKPAPEGASFCPYCGRRLHPLPPQRKKKTRKANGSGYVYRRGSTWTGRVEDTSVSKLTASGRVVYKYIRKGGFQTERAARDWCRAWYAGIREKPPAPPLAHYWDLYSGADMDKLSDSKRSAYTIAWKRCKALASRAVDTITVAQLRAVVAAQAKTYYTARDMKVLLSHLFELAGADGYVQKDLPSYIVLPKLEEHEAEIFTDLEQAKLWQAYEAGDMVAAWPLLMIYTGMMPAETMQLQIAMIDLDKRQIVGAGLKTSMRKSSAVILPEAIIPLVRDLIGERASGKLFPRNKDNLYRDYHALCARIGIRDLPPYSCRHTAGTALAITENIAPETVRRLMRWSQGSRMISRYAHPSQDDLHAAADLRQRPQLPEAQGK